MIPDLRCPIWFWIRTNASLTEIGEKLLEAGVISCFDADYENVYEWFVAKLVEYDVELNVSRVHHDFEAPKNEPLHFLLIAYRESDNKSQLIDWTYEVADSVCEALSQTVEIGEIEHEVGNEYRYHPSRIITPK